MDNTDRGDGFVIDLPVNDHQTLPAAVSLHQRWRVFFPLRLHPNWRGLAGGSEHDEESFIDASSEAEIREKIHHRPWLRPEEILRTEHWYELTGQTRVQLVPSTRIFDR